MKNNSVIKPLILIITAVLFLAFCYDLSTETIRSAQYAFLLICTVVVLLTFRRSFPDTAIFYTMLAGMFLRLTYVIS